MYESSDCGKSNRNHLTLKILMESAICTLSKNFLLVNERAITPVLYSHWCHGFHYLVYHYHIWQWRCWKELTQIGMLCLNASAVRNCMQTHLHVSESVCTLLNSRNHKSGNSQGKITLPGIWYWFIDLFLHVWYNVSDIFNILEITEISFISMTSQMIPSNRTIETYNHLFSTTTGVDDCCSTCNSLYY